MARADQATAAQIRALLKRHGRKAEQVERLKLGRGEERLRSLCELHGVSPDEVRRTVAR